MTPDTETELNRYDDVTVHFEDRDAAEEFWQPYEGDVRILRGGHVELLENGLIVAPHRVETIDR